MDAEDLSFLQRKCQALHDTSYTGSSSKPSALTTMVWYAMVNVDLYSDIVTKVSNALNMLVSTLCLKKTPLTFFAVTRAGIVGF